MAGAFRAATHVMGGRHKVTSRKRVKNRLVGDKIKVLRKENIPEKQAVAVAINMGKAGRLRPGGVYVRAKKGK